jgi:hypothetical protein
LASKTVERLKTLGKKGQTYEDILSILLNGIKKDGEENG